MAMVNLLAETLEKLEAIYRTPEEVLYVNFSETDEYGESHQYSTTWGVFTAHAKDFNYNSGYGVQEVNWSLEIVGADWWLERGEYDGSEWWRLCSKPHKHEMASWIDLEN